MSLAAAFADIALSFSAAVGAPFVDANIITPGAATYDSGGDIATPANPTTRACKAQADEASEAMRGENGYADGDIRILILSASFTGSITTDDRVQITAGVYAGTYSVESIRRDPANIGFELRGRRG
ncbi:hypothetical protein [Sphingosinicella xenopeptidilytica]|uniref:Uncharacterized protein n=1 Tax=Sphingosinicella xenopeptidilytica TaxID=364098 RepID=A0ABW3C159_SPHXN